MLRYGLNMFFPLNAFGSWKSYIGLILVSAISIKAIRTSVPKLLNVTVIVLFSLVLLTLQEEFFFKIFIVLILVFTRQIKSEEIGRTIYKIYNG